MHALSTLILLLASWPTFAAIDLTDAFERATAQPSAKASLGSFRLALPGTEASTPDQWDGASAFPPVVRQAPLGACQSFALTALMEYAFYRRTGQVVNFSEKAAAYSLLRYMIDEFYDAATDSYPATELSGRPDLGSGVAMYMIDSLLKSGVWPDAVYSLGSLEATEGSLNLDVPLYMSVFEKATTTLKREEYLTKLDEIFFSPPPARFLFKVPYLDFASGKNEVWEGHSPAELLSLTRVTKESFTVYHNRDLAPFFQDGWQQNREEINRALSEGTRKKGIREEILGSAELEQKIISSLESRMVVMVAASVWSGSWTEKDRVYNGGGGHAMVIVGYQKTESGTYFKLRNSWGTNIGQNGYNLVASKVLLPNLLEVTTLGL